jgi:predicted GTPase
MPPKNVLILGAAGRDFHNFNTTFRDNPNYRVVGFTATQIPGIDDRRYPPALAGSQYPQGIPIYKETDLETLIDEKRIDQVVFAYSDVPHVHVMHLAARANARGADFTILGGRQTMLHSAKKVIAICAVRTGCGKSQTARHVAALLKQAHKQVVVVRHPMPYGDLARQAVQRFASHADLDHHQCTIEEREEYEAHLDAGTVVFAGVDYARILERAQSEADVILWDGGNNDTPFFQPDLWLTVADPLRSGHELTYFPGETNFRGADVIVVNKATVAAATDLATIVENARRHNPRAMIVRAESALRVDDPTVITGRRVLTVDDGPTVTHGEMPFGAAKVAAEQHGAAEIIDPRPFARGSIAETYAKYPHLQRTLPAMGYSLEQIKDLERSINDADCDSVVFATPIDLGRLVTINKPATRVHYYYKDLDQPFLSDVLHSFLQ